MTPDQLLVRLSAAIYGTEQEFRDTCSEQGIKIRRWISRGGAQAALVSNDRWNMLVFRGTQVTGGPLKQRIYDVFSNLKLWGRDWPGPGHAHEGYAREVERVREEATAMAKYVDEDVPLYFTGHSMGGVMAHLAGAWAAHSGVPVSAVVSFGAPKGGDDDCWTPLQRVTVRRYAIDGDFAPHWPPVWWLKQPAPAIKLASPMVWPGPVSRHMVSNYKAALNGE